MMIWDCFEPLLKQLYRNVENLTLMKNHYFTTRGQFFYFSFNSCSILGMDVKIIIETLIKHLEYRL